ncbi:hypothetical protein ACHAW5_009983 [Stephanodiscus triporus]|uniref:HSF-type DNA-binding domain-containing protein n=1 Tax=Stephanodiscus triporus TaxID=2934178 RepID=A0ABD3PPM9_9STRA
MSMKKSKVDHTYTDHSQDLVLNYDQESNKNLFPAKLHKIVSTPGYQHIIAWRPHGRAWKIVNKPLFISVVLPEHFNHSNFSSFNRSVNGWGFKRLAKEGPDHNAYYHPLFLRGKLELTSAMTRLVNPGRRLTNKDAEPDLYEISRRYTLDPVPGIANNPPMVEAEANSNKRASSPILAIPGMPYLAHRPSHYNHPLPAFHHPMPYNYNQHPPRPQQLLHLNCLLNLLTMYNLVISHRTLPHNQWETNMLQGIMIHGVNRPQLIVIGIPACLITIGIPVCLLTNGIVGGIRSCLITNCIRARAGLLWKGIRKSPNLLVQPVRVINTTVKESSYVDYLFRG